MSLLLDEKDKNEGQGMRHEITAERIPIEDLLEFRLVAVHEGLTTHAIMIKEQLMHSPRSLTSRPAIRRYFNTIPRLRLLL